MYSNHTGLETRFQTKETCRSQQMKWETASQKHFHDPRHMELKCWAHKDKAHEQATQHEKDESSRWIKKNLLQQKDRY